MSVKDMVQYKRTFPMEQLYLMLNNDSKAYELWHEYAEKYAKKMFIGEAILMENLAIVMLQKISQSCDRLISWHRKVICEPLNLTKDEKDIVAWQWFYQDLMETYNFLKNN